MASDRLNDYERGVLLPLVVGFLQSSGTRVVPGDALAAAVRKQGHVCDRRQIRLIVNHIRTNAIIPCLASNNKGYFVATNERDITETINSLQGRVDSIQGVIEALKEQRYIKYNI